MFDDSLMRREAASQKRAARWRIALLVKLGLGALMLIVPFFVKQTAGIYPWLSLASGAALIAIGATGILQVYGPPRLWFWRPPPATPMEAAENLLRNERPLVLGSLVGSRRFRPEMIWIGMIVFGLARIVQIVGPWLGFTGQAFGAR